MIRAFRDTWELGIHSYLSYLRDRLLLVKELLSESGSCFVQISDANVHHVRQLMDEVFGSANFQAQINFKSTSALGQSGLAQAYDYLIWYSRDKLQAKFRPLFLQRDIVTDKEWRFLDDSTESIGYRKLTEGEFAELRDYEGIFRRSKLTSSGFTPSCTFAFELNGVRCQPFGRKSWATNREGIQELITRHRLFLLGGSPYFKQYFKDFPVTKLENSWHDQPAAEARDYVVQTAAKFVQRCLLMTTDPGDLVLDPTCGSGTTAFVAERWGRRWITCDTSRVAIALSRQRLSTAHFDFYELTLPQEGVDSGFRYRAVPHVTLKSIANGEPPGQETLYDQPAIDRDRHRVTGPFTVEAVPAPSVRSLNSLEDTPSADESIARSGETLRVSEWRDELLKTGVRARGGERIDFSRIEPLAGTRWLHADGETKEANPRRVVVSFGPEHAPLEQRQVALAIEEAQNLAPKPTLVLFCSFHFDPEAAKDIEETNWPGVTLVKVQMNTDLLTEDLKKKRSSNESFWLVGQPDLTLTKIGKGDDTGKFQVEVNGFDYYNPKTGTIESGGPERIALWMLDPNYDGRSLFPRQVFFPMAGEDGGWAKLAKTLRAEIDEEKIEAYRGTVSLPFEAGKYGRAAVKIVDDRGIESLKLIDLS
jgi:adenine-specific DNA-methyltransferase